MNEVEFIEFLNSCISALKIAKGINLEIRGMEKRGEKIYQVLFTDSGSGKRFEIPFFLPIIEQINTDEDKLRVGETIIRMLYRTVKHK